MRSISTVRDFVTPNRHCIAWHNNKQGTAPANREPGGTPTDSLVLVPLPGGGGLNTRGAHYNQIMIP